MLSTWIAENDLHCSLNIGVWEGSSHEPIAWGILLADTVRHMANALQERYGRSRPDTLAAILESLHHELGNPSRVRMAAFIPDIRSNYSLTRTAATRRGTIMP